SLSAMRSRYRWHRGRPIARRHGPGTYAHVGIVGGTMSTPREPFNRDAFEERVDAVLDAVKPKLRGWLHLAMAPIAFIGGLVLVVFGDTVQARASAAVFTVTAVFLFSMSAVYHRGNWSPRWGTALKRIDHSNI